VIGPLGTGINESSKKNNLIVYPNSVSHEINISTLPGSVIEFYNLQGKTIKTLSGVSGNTTVNVGSFSNGIYLIRCHTMNGISKATFVKE